MAAVLVQSKSAAVNTGIATNTVTWDTPATAGNLLVIIVGADDYITAPNRPSGYTLSTGMAQETFLGHYLFWKVAAGGETSAQYTLSSAATGVWITMEISGLDASPYDGSNGQFVATGGIASYTTPAITPTSGDRYVIASMGGSLTSALTTMGTWLNSFTERQDIANTLGSGTRDIIGAADLSATYGGATAVSSGATYATSVTAATGLIIAFKVSSGGGGTPEIVRQQGNVSHRPRPFAP